jgi:DNA-directed RNA polymerase specialized sigma24 family protein
MLNPIPDYAPDLEWMLQSGQVSNELLLEALVVEYYPAVFRLAHALLDDQTAARKAADKVFSLALLELYSYRAQDGVEIWLYRIAMETCQRSHSSLETLRNLLASMPFAANLNLLGDTLPESETDAEIWLAVDDLEVSLRQILIFRFILDWQPSRISALMGTDEQSLQAAVELIQNVFDKKYHPASSAQPAKQPAHSDEIFSTIKESLEKRWPLPKFTESEQEKTLARISRQTKIMHTRRRGIVSVLEVGLIVLIILLGTGIAWGMNLFGEAEKTPAPTELKQETVLVTKIVYQYITATPEAPQADQLVTSTPFEIPSSQFTYSLSGESLEDLATRLAISPESLRNLNRLPQNVTFESGQRLLLPDQWEGVVIPSPSPVPQVVPGPSLGEPYIAEMVVQRFAVQGPRYNTLWIDAQVTDYGPLSYIGPPRIYRGQMWVGLEQSLGLIGFPDRLPLEAVLRLGRNGYLARPAADAPWFSEWRENFNYSSPSVEVLQLMAEALFDTRSLERNTITVFGREEQAGIQSLVLDVFNQNGFKTDRIWYDDSRGSILKRIRFQPDGRGEPNFEVQVDSVAYDVDFPQQLFDTRLPWRGGFASEPSGTPAENNGARASSSMNRTPLEAMSAPTNFNPAESHLTFQYSPSFSIHSPFSIIELFADNYSLGPIFFGNPWRMICQRSPNGEWLAFVDVPQEDNDTPAVLNWFNLSEPEQSYESLTANQGVTDFAFSPDSRLLAYFTRPGSSGMGMLRVIELTSQEDEPLLIIGDIDSLIWSPDGASLAMITRFDPGSYLESITVFDLETQRITYNAPIDILSHSVRDWPMLDWGVEFPVEMGGMDDCSIPPIH